MKTQSHSIVTGSQDNNGEFPDITTDHTPLPQGQQKVENVFFYSSKNAEINYSGSLTFEKGNFFMGIKT